MSGKLDTIPLALVDHASVSCYINNSLDKDLTSAGNGYYTSDSIVKAGNIYRFQVTIPGFPLITATDTIPEPVRLTRIEHINEAGINEEGRSYPAIRITFPIDRDRVHYYQVAIKMKVYDNWQAGQMRDFSDPVLLAEGLPIAVFSTARIQDTTYTLHIDYSTGHYSRIDHGPWKTELYPLVVEFKSISYQYYEYLRQLYLYNTGRFPDFMFGPYKAYPLYSNVINGMGIVAGYSKYVSDIITPEN